MEKRNVTISLRKSLVRQAKIIAVSQDKSLNELIREALEDRIRSITGYGEAQRRQIKMMRKGFDMGSEGKGTWTRDELHERR